MTPTETSPLAYFVSPKAWKRLGVRLRLSQRELQIAQGVLRDRKESAIARDLGMSRHTVHTHLERLYAKLSVRNRAELMLVLFGAFLCLTAVPGSKLPPICGDQSTGRCPLRS
ncbi:MAG: helix-turn-helix transcriptional regulator [Tepidisphaeraceae bacterium]|jgi:DNA-binding CsgD family transcriptional regulator